MNQEMINCQLYYFAFISQKNKTIAKFRIGIPMTAGKKGNSLIVFDLPAVLDQEPPTEAKPWRLPKQK